MERLVPNIGICTYNAKCRGRLCFNHILQIGCRTRVEKLKETCFRSRGLTLNLFNLLPTLIRGLSNCDITKFKNALDLCLQIIDDQPLTPGYTLYITSCANQ